MARKDEVRTVGGVQVGSDFFYSPTFESESDDEKEGREIKKGRGTHSDARLQ